MEKTNCELCAKEQSGDASKEKLASSLMELGLLNENYQNILCLLLRLMNQKLTRQGYLDNMVRIIYSYTGIQCVGIRMLNENRYIPYESCIGFSEDFWQKENFLNIDKDQCSCVRIFHRNPDPLELELMTASGSLFCPDIRALADKVPEENRSRYRGSCYEAGFATVAVIPILHQQEITGVLHLCDTEPNRLSLADIEFLELIAPIIGDALHTYQLGQQMKEHEELYQAIMNEVKDSLFIVTQDGKILECNQAACSLYQYSHQEFLSLTIMDIRVGSEPEEVKRQMGQALESGIVFETIHARKNGTLFPVEISSSGIRFKGQRVVLSIVRDITERKQAQEELLARNRELDQFAYVVSHDLKAPLRAVNNLSSWIKEDMDQQPLSDEVRSNMELMRRRVVRMENLIDGILAYSRAGRSKSPLVTCPVRELLAEIWEDLNPPLGFQLEIASEMPVLLTEALKLRQVFTNLLDNAVKHHHCSEGYIRIFSEDAGRFFRFSVVDDGPGIAEQHHEKIFVLFQTLLPKDQKENTGVGLALVKKIVEEQKGNITLHSQEGTGSTFSFTWAK